MRLIALISVVAALLFSVGNANADDWRNDRIRSMRVGIAQITQSRAELCPRQTDTATKKNCDAWFGALVIDAQALIGYLEAMIGADAANEATKANLLRLMSFDEWRAHVNELDARFRELKAIFAIKK